MCRERGESVERGRGVHVSMEEEGVYGVRREGEECDREGRGGV